ncbi:hypothetical protein Cch01nite_11220 [Cellulomonas chitinilytica]|uniref:Uncharacterized protein n=1 Tax=Cellulomonas chitinilytica TaxID=398759 RepID=A0A919P1Y5_9CELL|nr:hypothetical protein [Cellulomonas chitinilytica]GIG20398.1 hypothetical protein Cch01nite_11220 [Cellulomonas chitinilytica]
MTDRLHVTPPTSQSRSFARRVAVGTILSAVLALLLVSLVLVAVLRRDHTEAAFGWVFQAMVVVVGAVLLRPLWRWVLAERPQPDVPARLDEIAEPRAHEGISGKVAPPRRW